MSITPSQVQPLLVGDPRISSWYSTGGGCTYTTILEDAYKDAIAFLKLEIPKSDDSSWIDKTHSMDDLQQTLWEAKKRYEGKSQTKARKWLTAFSTRVTYFGTVLDVLVQHHPEYVSLVWGSFKFVFIGILNSEQLIKEMAKACCKIADILPRTELSLLLYPTDRMRAGVAQLYSHILLFVRKAVRWYRKGKIMHALTSIIRPWPLEFEEDAKEIHEISLQIEANASAASRAELRSAHLEIYKLHTQISQVSTFLSQEATRQAGAALVQQQLQNQVILDLGSQKEVLNNIVLTQILSTGVFQNLPTSGESLHHCQTFSSRRQKRAPLKLPQLTALNQWASECKTSVLVANGGNSMATRDFLVDLTLLIRSSNHAVIWALRFPDFSQQPLAFTHIIQTLVAQALQANPAACSNGPHALTAGHLRDAVDDTEWLRILNEALKGLTHVFIVIDADLLNYATASDRAAATRCIVALQKLITSTYVKIFLSDFSVDKFYSSLELGACEWTSLQIGESLKRFRPRGRYVPRKRRARR